MVLVFIFLFTRPRRISTTEVRLELGDFDHVEVQEHFLPVTVDPGRYQVFAAAIGYKSNDHEIRYCICYTGPKKKGKLFVERLKIQMGMKGIEANISSPKTVNPFQIIIFQNLNALFSFYSRRFAAFRFHDYQGRQRTNALLTNILLRR
jgi:hypothetical protein